MKKIQLSDGMPTYSERKRFDSKTLELANKLKKECVNSGLSYTEINKALYLADKELYIGLLNKRF